MQVRREQWTHDLPDPHVGLIANKDAWFGRCPRLVSTRTDTNGHHLQYLPIRRMACVTCLACKVVTHGGTLEWSRVPRAGVKAPPYASLRA
jgi:ferredoxin-like protein FixX